MNFVFLTGDVDPLKDALPGRRLLVEQCAAAKTYEYTGTPPFANAEWKDDPTMCQWCAGTGHPHGKESNGICRCPELKPTHTTPNQANPLSQPVTMPEPIVSRERVEREARAAARTYNNVNDACPYPFATDAGHYFAAEFKRARAVINAANYSNTTLTKQATT